jgi:hypothetical protein
LTPRERHDPPVLRVPLRCVGVRRFATELAAKSGWSAARIERVLWHGGLYRTGDPRIRSWRVSAGASG